MSQTDPHQDTSRTNFLLTFAGALGSILLFVIILLITYVPERPSSVNAAQAQARTERLQELQAKHRQELTTYEVIDRTEGVVRIPIDRAMELTVRDLERSRD